MVTDLAKVSDIFKYILAIAWFYLSDTEYSIIDSLKLPLDAKFQTSWSCLRWRWGDIIINQPNLTVMLEATLK
mgnify:CR=1 FL=1